MIKKRTKDLILRVVFINSDLTMTNAIALEFLNSIYYLCLFYIDLKLKKNLQNKLSLNEFKTFCEDFFEYKNTLILNIFKCYWKSLKSKYTLANSYFK